MRFINEKPRMKHTQGTKIVYKNLNFTTTLRNKNLFIFSSAR